MTDVQPQPALPDEPDDQDGTEDGDDSILTGNDPAKPDGEEADR